MRLAILAILLTFTGCNVVQVQPGPNALQNAAQLDTLVVLEPGDYGDQAVDAHDVAFVAKPGATLRSLDATGSRLLFSGVDIDAGGAQRLGLHLSGDSIGFHNASVGNVHNEKGALVSGRDITIASTRFHDVTVDEGVHNECLYAIVVPGLTLRDNLFRECATFDVFFTYGFWWSPLPDAYGDVTMTGNDFGVTRKADGSPHYYSVMAAYTGNGPTFPTCGSSSEPQGYLTNWVIKNNIFRLPTAYIIDCAARWRGVTWESNTGG
jgi:hypothetical protein